MKYTSLDEIHSDNKYISNQSIIFSEENKDKVLSDLARHIGTEHFDETVDWLNSVTESKWNKLYRCLKILENEHKKNIEIITNLVGADKSLDYSGALEAIKYLQQSLNSIGFMLLTGGAIAKNLHSITGMQNRAKRKDEPNPNMEKARLLAITKWEQYSKISLLDMAFIIKQELNINKGATTIQEWIRDLNPNAKSRKTK